MPFKKNKNKVKIQKCLKLTHCLALGLVTHSQHGSGLTHSYAVGLAGIWIDPWTCRGSPKFFTFFFFYEFSLSFFVFFFLFLFGHFNNKWMKLERVEI
jgi:hypothetical protein